jgi:Beta xylosidase C-terminal Concanavalin A-like domain
VRVVQTIGSENFDVAVKIDSPLFATDGNTSQGLMILSESEDFITFALTTDGTKIGLNARTVTTGVATTVLDDIDLSQYQNPMYLRVTKAGSPYVAFYSVDGTNWTQAASVTDSTIFSSFGPSPATTQHPCQCYSRRHVGELIRRSAINVRADNRASVNVNKPQQW